MSNQYWKTYYGDSRYGSTASKPSYLTGQHGSSYNTRSSSPLSTVLGNFRQLNATERLPNHRDTTELYGTNKVSLEHNGISDDKTDRYNSERRREAHLDSAENKSSKDSPDHYETRKASTKTYHLEQSQSQENIKRLIAATRQLQGIDLDAVEKLIGNYKSSEEAETLKEELQQVKKQCAVLEETCKNVESKGLQATEDIKEYDKKFKQAREDLIKKDKEVQHLKGVLAQKIQELKDITREKDNALSRLSKEMGEKLHSDNPAIADLSDPNRSTKVAELYNSIYDNEWTDALEDLQGERLEEELAVRALLEIMKGIYDFCASAINDHMQQLEDHLLNPFTTQRQGRSEETTKSSASKQIRTMLMDCIKLGAKDMIPTLTKNYLGMKSKARYAELVPDYASRVMELCWLMNLCSPPLAFGEQPNTGDILDKNLYKEYTKQGEIVSYVVWLPLLIEKGGAVLTKGVAQPIPMPVSSVPKQGWSTVKERTTTTSKTDFQNEKKDRAKSENREDVVTRLFETNTTGRVYPRKQTDTTTDVPHSNELGSMGNTTTKYEKENIPASDFMKSFKERTNYSYDSGGTSYDNHSNTRTRSNYDTTANKYAESKYGTSTEEQQRQKYTTPEDTGRDNYRSSKHRNKDFGASHIDNIEYNYHTDGRLIYRMLPNGKWHYCT